MIKQKNAIVEGQTYKLDIFNGILHAPFHLKVDKL